MIRSFPPIINSETEILIVGTMPSVKSLEAQQYYAHPRNAFWKIIDALYHQGAEFADFQEKKACLLANRLGLWDSLQLCLREGSLDSAITDEQPNDFNTLLAEHPAVRRLLFNGQPAFKFFKKYHAPLLLRTEYYILPSTSPANASYSLDDKIRIWAPYLK